MVEWKRRRGHNWLYRPYGSRYIYDVFVPPNLLIEVNGDYWHSLPKMQQRDKRKKDWAESNSYVLISLLGSEIKSLGADTMLERTIFENEQFDKMGL